MLVIVSFLPNSTIKNNLEHNLGETLINQEIVTPQSDLNTNIKYVKKINNFKNISANSRAALFVDKETGEILFEKNIDEKLPMASITKLMTALIAIENIEPNEILTVPKLNTRPLDSRMWLTEGDKIIFSELLNGLLINSASDAALTISNHVSGGEKEFAALMNEKAKLIGLNDTQFTNSVGWDEPNHESNVRDLVNLSNLALSNKQIRGVVKKKSYIAKSTTGKKYYLLNTNALLGLENYYGIKTGTTYAAGECVAVYYNDGEREIIGVLLNSQNRFGETEKIVEWIKENFIFYD